MRGLGRQLACVLHRSRDEEGHGGGDAPLRGVPEVAVVGRSPGRLSVRLSICNRLVACTIPCSTKQSSKVCPGASSLVEYAPKQAGSPAGVFTCILLVGLVLHVLYKLWRNGARRLMFLGACSSIVWYLHDSQAN